MRPSPSPSYFPHEVHLHAAQLDVDLHTSHGNPCAHPKVRVLVLTACNAAGKRNGFKSIGLLLAVILTADEWAPERVGHFGAENLTEEDCTEVRCRDFGAFSSSQSHCCIASCLHFHATIHAGFLSQLTDNKSFTGGVWGTENETCAGKPRRFSQSIGSFIIRVPW